MTADIPNAFLQADMPQPEHGEDQTTMKITGHMVDILMKINPGTYQDFIVMEKGRKVIYVKVLKAIYGTLMAALLWYKKFKKDLEEQGFIFNSYDPCVVNRSVKGNQQTIRFHIDNLCSSHVDKTVNDEFLKWLNEKYGEHGKVEATRGRVHEYLGMKIIFEGKSVKIDMKDYIRDMIEEGERFIKKNDKVATPAQGDLFNEDQGRRLSEEDKATFHKIVAKGLFLAKRARPDIQPVISVLCTRVRNPGVHDWDKMVRMLRYLNGTVSDVLTVNAEKGLHCIE